MAQAQGVCASTLVPGHLSNEEVEARHNRLFGQVKKVIHRARTARHRAGGRGWRGRSRKRQLPRPGIGSAPRGGYGPKAPAGGRPAPTPKSAMPGPSAPCICACRSCMASTQRGTCGPCSLKGLFTCVILFLTCPWK